MSQAGRSGEVAVVSYDFVPETVDLVREGTIVATSGQDPFGAAYNTAALLFNHLAEGNELGSYFIDTTVR